MKKENAKKTKFRSKNEGKGKSPRDKMSRENKVDDFGGKSYDPKSNHPSWYKTNEQLAKDTASIPFGYALGVRKDHGVYGDRFNDYAVAGIMRINFMPIYGTLDKITSPLNIASRNIYTNLKSVNSRAKTYDAPDIAIYLCAVDNLLAFHEWMKRIYGLMNTASVTNRYYAEAAVRAAGGDYSDILYNINDYRAYINRFALRISTLPIPANMSVFSRHAWLNSHVWYDSDLPTKAQSYVFSPTGFWKYGLDLDGAGQLTYERLIPDRAHNPELTFNQIKEFGESLISAVLYGAGDEDFNIMGGDILYAYGENNIYRATTISEDYAVIPTYDAWVCDQINNVRAFGILDDSAFTIKQDEEKRFLVQTLELELPNTFNGVIPFNYPWNVYAMDQYVNIYDGDTSADHVMVATRMLQIPLCEVVSSENGWQKRKLVFDAPATEICEDFCVYYYATTTGSNADWKLFRSPNYKSLNFGFYLSGAQSDTASADIIAEAVDSVQGLIDCVGQLASFDRKPLMYNAVLNGYVMQGAAYDMPTIEYTPHANVDLNNYSIISRPVLKQMNETILLAMFGIDEFGKQISLK